MSDYELPGSLKRWESLSPRDRPSLEAWCRQHDIVEAPSMRETLSDQATEIEHLRGRVEEQESRNDFLVDELYRAWGRVKGGNPLNPPRDGEGVRADTISPEEAASRMGVEFNRFQVACQSPVDYDSRWVEILFVLGRIQSVIDVSPSISGYWDKREVNRFVIDCIKWIEEFVVGDATPQNELI